MTLYKYLKQRLKLSYLTTTTGCDPFFSKIFSLHAGNEVKDIFVKIHLGSCGKFCLIRQIPILV